MSAWRELVRRIKEEADIVEIVGRTVDLKRQGSSYMGRCPFHNEKTPSFSVMPSRKSFRCFGCGQAGSVVDFVMKIERLDFMEAVRKLAAEMKIDLPEVSPAARMAHDAEEKLREVILKANDAALGWFRRNLQKQANPRANEYLPERGLEPSIVEKFQIGSGLAGEWDALHRYLNQMGFHDEDLIRAGLLKRNNKGRLYDTFRNRLIIPIFDVNGRTCGFGGRALEKEDTPKYLNSPETALFKKSEILYGLNIARPAIEKSGYAILCEGYMDVIMCHAFGHNQAVASLGTALTKQQAKLLKRFAARAYFLYDGDSAGQRAMMKGGMPLLESGFDVRVIVLPHEHDPDSFLRAEGTEALTALMGEAVEFFDFALANTEREVDVRTLSGQAELVDRLAPVLLAMQNDVMREGAINRITLKLGGLPRDAINQILVRKRRELEKRDQPQPPTTDGTGGGPLAMATVGIGAAEGAMEAIVSPVARQQQHRAPEQFLLWLMTESNAALEFVRANLVPDWLRDEAMMLWIMYLVDNPGYAQTLIDEAELAEERPGPWSVMLLVRSWVFASVEDPEKAAEITLRRLHNSYLRGLIEDLKRMLTDSAMSEEEQVRLLRTIDLEARTLLREVVPHMGSRDYSNRPMSRRRPLPPAPQ